MIASYDVFNPGLTSPFLLLCDHASAAVPSYLGNLGLEEPLLESHSGWDLHILGVSREISMNLGCTLVSSKYSRLVIDCNRPLDSPELIRTEIDGEPIPGNRDIDEHERTHRIHSYFLPYHSAVSQKIEKTAGKDSPLCLVSMHSFTPVFDGEFRPWHIGISYEAPSSLSGYLLERLGEETGITLGNNQPYQVTHETDYTLPFHSRHEHVDSVLIEIRQDIAASKGIRKKIISLLSSALMDYRVSRLSQVRQDR